MKCCICGKEIAVEPSGWSQGHNARPVRKGRCCSTCNESIVIPVRIMRVSNIRLQETRLSEVEKNDD